MDNTENVNKAAGAPSGLNVGLCAGIVKTQKLFGGGTSWYYALCSCGYTLGASHQDDRAGMEKLRNLTAHNITGDALPISKGETKL